MAIAEAATAPAPAIETAAARVASVHLVPSHGLIWARTVRNAAAIVLPIYATSIYIHPGVHSVAVTSIAAFSLVLFAVLLGWRISRASVTLQPDGVDERVIFPPDNQTPMGAVVRGVSVLIRRSRSATSQRQVFFQDEAGRTRLRLRAAYWGDAQIEAVARHLGVQIWDAGESVSMTELRALNLVRLYWFEEHPVLTDVAVIIAGAALAVTIALVV